MMFYWINQWVKKVEKSIEKAIGIYEILLCFYLGILSLKRETTINLLALIGFINRL